MKYIGYLILLVLIILGVSFAVLNSNQVAVNYYFATQKVSLSLLLVIAFAIGVLLALIVMLFKLIGCKMENRRLRKQLRNLEKQMS